MQPLIILHITYEKGISKYILYDTSIHRYKGFY